MRAAPSLMVIRHNLGEFEELRADLQRWSPRRRGIDFDADPVVDLHEVDHGATFGAAVQITHGQGRFLLKKRANVW